MEALNTTACSSRLSRHLFYFSQKKTWLHVAQGWFHSPHTLQVTLADSGSTLARATNPNINDQKCNRGQCSLCEVSAPVRKVAIRGLCLLSIFDRSTYHPFQFCELYFNGQPIFWKFFPYLGCLQCLHGCFVPRAYNYIINEDGQPMFVGTHTSIIFYNRTMSSWVW